MKLLADLYAKMSDEERQLFMQARQQRSHDEMMSAIQSLGNKVGDSRQSWVSDFGANIAGNAVWDAAVWIAAKLMRLH